MMRIKKEKVKSKNWLLLFCFLMFFTSISFAQWTGTSLRTDGKYRSAKNTATFLGKGADSVYAALSYIVNLDSISTDARIDSIKAILGRLETNSQTLNAKDFATQTTLAALNSKDFATATNQSAQTTKLTNIETNTGYKNISTADIITVNNTSYGQLASVAVKDFTVYNFGTSSAFISFDNGTNYIELFPKMYWKGEGIRNTNLVYIKGNVKIERRY